MDELILQYYRRLIKGGFKNAGSYEDPSILLNTVGALHRLCPGSASFVRVYINVKDGVISGVKYLCSCEPATNVAVEILCDLVTGKTLDEAAALTDEMFLKVLGGPSEDLRKRAETLIEILSDGIQQYRPELPAAQGAPYTVSSGIR